LISYPFLQIKQKHRRKKSLLMLRLNLSNYLLLKKKEKNYQKLFWLVCEQEGEGLEEFEEECSPKGKEICKKYTNDDEIKIQQIKLYYKNFPLDVELPFEEQGDLTTDQWVRCRVTVWRTGWLNYWSMG